MRILQTIRSLRLFIVLAVIVTFGESCKPRRSRSSLESAESAMAASEEISRSLQEMEQRARAFQREPMVNDDALNNFLQSKERSPVPPGCDPNVWETELSWRNPFMMDLLKKSRTSPGDKNSYYQVRLMAIATIAELGDAHGVLCWRAMVDQLLRTAADMPPIAELRRVETPHPSSRWVCSTYLHCSEAMEIVNRLLKVARHSEALFEFTKQIRDDLLGLRFSPVLTDIMDLRINSLFAYRLLLIESNLLADDRLGTKVSMDPAKVQQLREWYDGLISQYKITLERLNSEDRFNATVRPAFRDQFVTLELFEEKNKIFEELPQEQQEHITAYIAGIIQTATKAHEYNIASREYLDRLNQNDPRPWITKLLKRASLFKAHVGDSEWSESARQPDPDMAPLNPLHAFLALTIFFEQEIYAPFRADFTVAIQSAFQMMESSQRAAMLSTLRMVAKYNGGYANLFASYGRAYANIPQDGSQLTEPAKVVIKEAEAMFARLLQAESRIATSPGMEAFQSLHVEAMEYAARLNRRTAALGLYTKYWVDEGELKGWDRYMSPRERRETYRMLFAPSTGSDELKFNLTDEHYHVISQWIVVHCLDRMFGQGAEPSLVLNKPFYIDKTPVNFTCQKGESFTSLRQRAFKYASTQAVGKIEQELWKAIKGNPFLHGAQMLALSTIMGPMGGKIFRLIGRLGTVAKLPPMLQIVFSARLVGFAKLGLDSYLFAIAEHYVGQGADSILGIKYSAQEQSLHQNPFTNVSGMVTGALIFGMIPQAHHAADFLVRASAGKVIGKKWIVNTLSGGAQYAAETALFTWNPIEKGMEIGNEWYQKYRLEFHELTADEEIMIRMNGQTGFQKLIGSMITAGAFSAHRFAGMGLHQSGLPTNMAHEFAYFGVKTKAALGRYKNVQKENLYETLNVSRNATDAEIMQAYEHARNVWITIPERREAAGLWTYGPGEKAKFQAKFKQIEGAAFILLGRPGWSNYVNSTTPGRSYLIAAASARAQHDREIYPAGKDKFLEGDHDYISKDVPDLRPRANN